MRFSKTRGFDNLRPVDLTTIEHRTEGVDKAKDGDTSEFCLGYGVMHRADNFKCGQKLTNGQHLPLSVCGSRGGGAHV